MTWVCDPQLYEFCFKLFLSADCRRATFGLYFDTHLSSLLIYHVGVSLKRLVDLSCGEFSMRCHDLNLRSERLIRLLVACAASIFSANLLAADGVDSPVIDQVASQESPSEDSQPSSENGFLRLRYPCADRVSSDGALSDGDRVLDPIALDTAIVSFDATEVNGAGVNGAGVNGTGTRVDLVAAVHVGERSYYDVLNRRFADYDVVLYELVAEPETRLTPQLAERRDNPVNVLQGGMQDALGLSHQLASVDYLRDNFVRADMTPQEFMASMRKREESFAKMFFRMAGNALAAQSEDAGAGDLRIMAALLKPDREHQLKLAMAEQLFRFGGSLRALDGPEGSTLVTERNKKALDGLREQMALGKKRVAIFYGAAHMPDLQKHLEEDFQLRRGVVEWIEAWNLQEVNDETRKGQAGQAVNE